MCAALPHSGRWCWCWCHHRLPASSPFCLCSDWFDRQSAHPPVSPSAPPPPSSVSHWRTTACERSVHPAPLLKLNPNPSPLSIQRILHARMRQGEGCCRVIKDREKFHKTQFAGHSQEGAGGSWRCFEWAEDSASGVVDPELLRYETAPLTCFFSPRYDIDTNGWHTRLCRRFWDICEQITASLFWFPLMSSIISLDWKPDWLHRINQTNYWSLIVISSPIMRADLLSDAVLGNLCHRCLRVLCFEVRQAKQDGGGNIYMARLSLPKMSSQMFWKRVLPVYLGHRITCFKKTPLENCVIHNTTVRSAHLNKLLKIS